MESIELRHLYIIFLISNLLIFKLTLRSLLIFHDGIKSQVWKHEVVLHWLCSDAPQSLMVIADHMSNETQSRLREVEGLQKHTKHLAS